MADKRRLTEQHKGDRRVREQHNAMLASVRGLKEQVETELAVRKQLEAQLAELKAKVSTHKPTNNADEAAIFEGSPRGTGGTVGRRTQAARDAAGGAESQGECKQKNAANVKKCITRRWISTSRGGQARSAKGLEAELAESKPKCQDLPACWQRGRWRFLFCFALRAGTASVRPPDKASRLTQLMWHLQVKHEASKNAMHRENERVLDST